MCIFLVWSESKFFVGIFLVYLIIFLRLYDFIFLRNVASFLFLQNSIVYLKVERYVLILDYTTINTHIIFDIVLNIMTIKQ